ncbi:MAG: molybdenum cofactor guanylyltransferase [Gammaproteobacteria bacterium]|nr:molybdenum cofactor guanylyltransferase [Gammaproteobacteria bacterium]
MPNTLAFHQSLCVIVLAGGKSTRMGGKNKSLLPLNGTPLIQHVLQRIPKDIPQILISANDHPEHYQQFGLPIIADNNQNYAGPLAGIVSCAPHINHPVTQIVSCDTPLLPLDLFSRLAAERLRQQCPIAVPHDGERLQLLSMQMETSCVASMEEALRRQEFAVYRWLQTQRFAELDCSHSAEQFANINTPDDLNRLESRIRHAR